MEPSNSSIHENQEPQIQIEDDEALSLCDLATNEPENPSENHPELQSSEEHQEDFNFNADFPENQMCSADEVFSGGQILPLRHSISSGEPFPSGLMVQTRIFTRSRSESVSVISSRSSSVRSHNSASSGSSTSGFELTGYKPRIRNQFHSHPSPTPQIRTRSSLRSNPKTSTKWSFLQLGVLNPQEIGLADLKNRSRRSNSSSTSSSMSGTMDQNHQNQNQKQEKKMMMKTKQGLLFGGCRCSADTIESRVSISSGISMVKETKLKEESKKLGISRGERKDAVSSHRTFEWLKQLSIQESASL